MIFISFSMFILGNIFIEFVDIGFGAFLVVVLRSKIFGKGGFQI